MKASHDPLNLIVCGVGGQGNVLTATILAKAFAKEGFWVSVADLFGMAQRGGPVSSFVRASKAGLGAPVIPRGQADIILALEPIEALRATVDFGNRGVIVIANTQTVATISTMQGKYTYPPLDTIKDRLNALSGKAYFVNATQLVLPLGIRLLSTLMLGTLVGTNTLPISRTTLESVLKGTFMGRILDKNLEAFEVGVKSVVEEND